MPCGTRHHSRHSHYKTHHSNIISIIGRCGGVAAIVDSAVILRYRPAMPHDPNPPHTSPATGEVRPHDKDSGLVERSWARTSRKGGTLTERTLEGETVTARFIGPHGGVERAEGKVVRTESGELAVESWADGIRRQTAVPRDASVDRTSR